MIGVADGEIQPDHVVGERHAGVERCRTGMIAQLRTDPGDAGGARLCNGDIGRARHHQMSHAVVAVDQRRAGALLHHADRGLYVQAAGLDAAGIRHETGDPMPVGALQVRACHQPCDNSRVLIRQTNAIIAS